MMLAIEDRLKEKDIQVELRDKGLAFIPASNMDDSIRGVLAAEGRGLYRVALEIRDRLQTLGLEAEGNPTGWKALHKRLTTKWPVDDPYHWDAYGYLVTWSGALLMRTTALIALRHALMRDEKAGRQADISFTDRLIPNAERRLVSTCILWPSIRKKIMSLRLVRRIKQDRPETNGGQTQPTASRPEPGRDPI